MTAEGEAMESLLTGDPPLPCEALMRMQWWYREAVDHTLPPAWVMLKRITVKREDLYCAIPPPGGDDYHICAALPNQKLRTYR